MSKKTAAIESPPAPARGFVLVGGRSSRFGNDKALHRIGGRPMALRVADVLGQVVESVTLVGRPEKYRRLGLPVIADKLDGIGPLGGILAALEESDAEWNLIVACDLPRIERSVLECLIHRARTAGADVVWPVTPDGRIQPLCAAYAKRAAGRARSQVERGVRKVADAFCGCHIDKPAFADQAPFRNANRASDLESLLEDVL